MTQIKARELTALRLFLRLGAAINGGDWETVRDLADELAVIAMYLTKKEATHGKKEKAGQGN